MSEHEVEDEAAAVSEGAVAEVDSESESAAAPGESPVAGALAELDTLAERDLADHPEVFERIHGQLHAALSAIDDA